MIYRIPFISPFCINTASDSDNNCEVVTAGRQYPSIQEFASAIPNHLLLGSLLEHLCFVYERDPAQSRMLFKGEVNNKNNCGVALLIANCFT